MKTVLIYSGGLDSSALLFELVRGGHEVHALSVDYGQRHLRELDSAHTLAKRVGVEHRVVDLSSLGALLMGSALTDREVDVPDGHYTEPSMRSTIVPNRNMVLLSLAGAWASAIKAESVSYAAHAGDHAIYPDCRPEFAEKMNEALGLCDWQPLRLDRPFLEIDKAAIVRRGQATGVPFEETWSCYRGETLHCGRCATCIERREAFHVAEIADPTTYQSDAPSVAELVAADWRL